MNKPLSYSDIYFLLEEISQLQNSRLQNVLCESSQRYYLNFYKSGESRWVILDLEPSRPFIVSINLAIPQKKKKVTPIFNFIKAHFKGQVLKKIYLAQKPNRTIKILFGDENKEKILEFFCYPHGQCLRLSSEDKTVLSAPLKEKEENVSFVEVDPPSEVSWKHNENLFSELKDLFQGVPAENKKHQSQIQKMEKSLKKIDENREVFMGATEEKIHLLEKKAEECKREGAGRELNALYIQIKKHRRSILEYGERRNQIQERLQKLQEHGAEDTSPIEVKKEKSYGFTGTRVTLDQGWELWVGRNASQNDELVRLGQPQDLWIHLRDYPGAHGLLRGPKGRTASDSHIIFSCQVVAQLSKSKKKPFQTGESFDFIVTPRKYVKKKKGMASGSVIVERENIRRVAYKEVKFTVS